MGGDMVFIAAVVLTKNEELRITDCLKRLRPCVNFILVVDGESSDRTVTFSKKYADKVIHRPFSGSFADERNFAHAYLPRYFLTDPVYILHVDADEKFDESFLQKIREIIENSSVISFRFPRINLPDAKDYPDYQVRLLKNDEDIVWRREVHEIPYSKKHNKPIDQVSCETLDSYPIIHLPRLNTHKRPWW